jgi:hypothetical protein
MPVIRCTHCGASGNAPEHILGQQVRCSKCKQSFIAAGPDEPTVSPFALGEPDPGEPEAPDEGFPTQDEIHDHDDDDSDDDIRRRPIRKSASQTGIADLLMFRRMIAPYLIIILFWLLLVLAVLGGLAMIVGGLLRGGQDGFAGAVAGVISLIVGPIAVRLWCEVLIVVFRINETLTDIRNEMKRSD